MGDTIYEVVGYQYGSFVDKDNNGRVVHYATLYCLESFKTFEGADRSFAGNKAVSFKCLSQRVLENVTIGDKVNLYFNQSGRVTLIVNV